MLNGAEIRELRMFEPFSEAVSGEGIISYGLTHAGYDLRLGPSLLIFRGTDVVDPKRFHDPAYRASMFEERAWKPGDPPFRLPPHSYALGFSYERISVPPHLKGRCVGKSTLARCGILVNTTPLEPGWRGYLTIEVANITPCPAVLYPMEGIAQLEFDVIAPDTTYEGKKYQDQGAAPVAARVI